MCCLLVTLVFSSRHLQTICYVMYPACLFIMISSILLLSHDAAAMLAFFLCLTLTKLFCLKVFSVLFPVRGKMPPQIAHMVSSFLVFRPQPKHPQRGFPNILRLKFPFVLPQRHLSQEFLSFAVCIRFPGELLKTQMAVSEFLT